jgi:hypothetical protein
MGAFTPHRGTHCFISNDTPISWASSLHRSTQHSISVSERNDTPISCASSLYRGTQRSIFVSKRNNTPISWAQPTHGLSHRPTHSVCVLEDVSRSCNHQQSQHSLLPRKVTFTPFTPNLIPIVDMVAYWQILGEYGCTLIIKSGL